MRHPFPPALLLSLLLTACGGTGSLQPGPGLAPTPDPTPTIAPVARQQLQPGRETKVALSVTPPTNGTPISSIEVGSAAPELVAATLNDRTVTLRASPNALPQGLIPVTVRVRAGNETAQVRIPVEIGDLITREHHRLNEVRAQAALPPVTFDEERSLNCWLHGRYGFINNRLEHTEDLTLPFATPEGKSCGERSNLSFWAGPVAGLGTATPVVDTLVTIPFHAFGMLDRNLRTSAVAQYTANTPNHPGFSLSYGAADVGDRAGTNSTRMTFPAAGATTDFSRYSGAEWPNPLTSCPGFLSTEAGLPLLVATTPGADTAASGATLSVDGRALEVCAYGSTQYVNTTDAPGNYTGGPRSAQDIARSILKGQGGVVLIPRQRLQAGKTYQVSVDVNGQRVAWSFKTSAVLRPARLDRATTFSN